MLDGSAARRYRPYVGVLRGGASRGGRDPGHTIGCATGLSPPALLVAGCPPATVGSLLLSGGRRLLVPGIFVAVGALICWTLWRLESVSTWRAFAAVCSVLLLGRVRDRPAPR
ncbi:DUF6629 family protein [Streptomyces sp. NPDC048737]